MPTRKSSSARKRLIHRFLWMVLRSVCSPRKKQKVEMQMAKQTREITMPTQVMTDSSSSLMRPWYWGAEGTLSTPTRSRLTLGSATCQLGARLQATSTAAAAPTPLAYCPRPTCWPPPLCRWRAHFLMLWKACGEMTKVTPTCFSRGPWEKVGL